MGLWIAAIPVSVSNVHVTVRPSETTKPTSRKYVLRLTPPCGADFEKLQVLFICI